MHRFSALIASTILSVAAPASAAGAVPRAFFGVHLDVALIEEGHSFEGQMRRIARTGAGSIVTSFNWGVDQQQRGGPVDFTRTDRIVRGAARSRLRVLPVVVTSPPWSRPPELGVFTPPLDPRDYAAYLTALIGRYGPRGSLWAQEPTLPRMPIRAWQVWNEPVGGPMADGPSVFWTDSRSRPFQVGYLELLRAAHAAIKAADRGAQVVVAGLVGRSWRSLEILYGAGARPLIDAVSLHPYTGRPADVVRTVRLVRGVMRRAGAGRVPIMLTEVGWPSYAGQLGPEREDLSRTQARWMRATLPALVRARRRLGITGLYWYTWMSRDASPDYAFDHAGLVRSEGGRVHGKPAEGAFRAIVRRARALPR